MKKILALALAAAMLFAVVGCTKAPAATETTNGDTTATEAPVDTDATEAPAELTKLVVSLHPAYITLPVAYAIYNDMAKDFGLELEVQVYASGAPQNEALGAGLWDVGVIGAAFAFGVNTYDAYVIGDFIDGRAGNAIFVRNDSDIANATGANPTYPDILGSAETVKGKTMITNVGTTGHLQAVKWLEALGLTEADVNIIQMDYAQGYQAFISGEGDILATIGPYSTKALIAQADQWSIAGGFLQLDIPQYETVICSADAMANKKDALVNFLRMIYAANDILANDFEAQVSTYMAWMSENGKEIDEAEARIECTQKPVLTSAQALELAKSADFGQYERLVWETNIESGTMEAASIAKADTNIIPDLMIAALESGK